MGTSGLYTESDLDADLDRCERAIDAIDGASDILASTLALTGAGVQLDPTIIDTEQQERIRSLVERYVGVIENLQPGLLSLVAHAGIELEQVDDLPVLGSAEDTILENLRTTLVAPTELPADLPTDYTLLVIEGNNVTLGEGQEIEVHSPEVIAALNVLILAQQHGLDYFEYSDQEDVERIFDMIRASGNNIGEQLDILAKRIDELVGEEWYEVISTNTGKRYRLKPGIIPIAASALKDTSEEVEAEPKEPDYWNELVAPESTDESLKRGLLLALEGQSMTLRFKDGKRSNNVWLRLRSKHKTAALNALIQAHAQGYDYFANGDLKTILGDDYVLPTFGTTLRILAVDFKKQFGLDLYQVQGTGAGQRYRLHPAFTPVALQDISQ